MEDTLRGTIPNVNGHFTFSLNPCFNGRYSQRIYELSEEESDLCLNPCFNGRYSQSQSECH